MGGVPPAAPSFISPREREGRSNCRAPSRASELFFTQVTFVIAKGGGYLCSLSSRMSESPSPFTFGSAAAPGNRRRAFLRKSGGVTVGMVLAASLPKARATGPYGGSGPKSDAVYPGLS